MMAGALFYFLLKTLTDCAFHRGILQTLSVPALPAALFQHTQNNSAFCCETGRDRSSN